MADLRPVVDPDDPRLGDYRALKDSHLRKRYEHELGVFIAEGPNVVRELLASDYATRSLLLSPERVDDLADELVDLDAEVFVADRELIRQVVRFDLHQGAIGCGYRRAPVPPDQLVRGARRVAVLEEMNDHENMGVVFRSARALGVDAVLLGPRSADPLYRRCVRVSMGHVLHVPNAAVGDLPGSLDLLHDAGLTTVALVTDADATPVGEVDRDRPLALLLGAEGPGLSPETVAAADVRARIPMPGPVDSLNVSVAASVAFHVLG